MDLLTGNVRQLYFRYLGAAFGSSLNMPSTSAIVKALKITNFSKILGVNIVANSTGAFITQTFSPRLIPVMGGSWRNVIWLFTGITLMFGLFAIFTISRFNPSLQQDSN